MKTSPKMQRVIEQLAKQHSLDLSQDEAHLRLAMPGFDRLVIENTGLRCICFCQLQSASVDHEKTRHLAGSTEKVIGKKRVN